MEAFRSDDILAVARIVYGKSGFMHPVYTDTSFVSFREEICHRHKIDPNDSFRLTYSTPGSIECMLHSEVDMRMMVCALKLYSLKEIEVVVHLNTVSKFKKGQKVFFELDGEVDENDYLGLPFKDVEKKPYLSDEWAFYITGMGQKFSGGITEFRDKLKKYAIKQGFSFVYSRNDSTYLKVVCTENLCSFFIKGSVFLATKCFYIEDCVLLHTCKSVLQSNKHERLDSDLVSNCMLTDVIFNPSIRPIDIKKKFWLNYGYDIGYKVAIKAKVKALQQIFGKDADSFNKLRWYIDAVKKTNPGSYVDLEVDPVTNKFSRVFIAYAGCVEGLKHCIPVVYVDGCFGKTVYKGQILAATAKDSNNGIFPIAICICDLETEDNWTYFCRCLKQFICDQPRVFTFISDRGKGLLKAFDHIFPDNPHLYCYHHLQGNLRRRFMGRGSGIVATKAAKCFEDCAYSSTEKEYNHNLKELRTNGGEAIIDDFLKDLPLKSWCRAYAIGCRFGAMANSIAECFNNWIIIERTMTVYCMLEEIRLKQMNLLTKHRTEGNSWITRLTPEFEKLLKKQTDVAKQFRVVKSDNYLYEVRNEFSYEVDLIAKTCSCVKWQINNFPCAHSISAMMFSDLDVYTFIDPLYSVERFRKCYAFSIKPVPNVEESLFECDEDFINAPSVKSQPGRRKKRRYKSVFEQGKRKKITCGRCGKLGNHNKLTCSEPIG